MNWTLIVAVLTAYLLIWQVRYSARVTTLMQLLDIWESPRLLALRVASAAKLLPNVIDDLHKNQTSKYPRYNADTTDLDGLLDFFETVAFFTRWRFTRSFPFIHTPVLDIETTWDICYWPLVNYWQEAKDYIHETQEREGAEVWQHLTTIAPKLIKREGGTPTAEAHRTFIGTEAAVDKYLTARRST